MKTIFLLLMTFLILSCGVKPNKINPQTGIKPGVTQIGKSVTFVYDDPTQSIKSIAITGDFDNWNKEGIPLTKIDGRFWSVTLDLEYGIYQYKYILDEKEVIPDPYAEAFAPDGKGGKNSILEVKKEQ